MIAGQSEELTEKLEPHHPRRFHIRGVGYFSRIGPGVVSGAADDDPSGIGTLPRY